MPNTKLLAYFVLLLLFATLLPTVTCASGRIVGGTLVPSGSRDYPYNIQLAPTKAATPDKIIDILCGGTLISLKLRKTQEKKYESLFY